MIRTNCRRLCGWAVQALLHFSLVLTLVACGDSRSLKWTEDVLLPDGRTVTLTRYQEFKGPHEIGDQPTESDYWLEFKNPDTGETVRWESNRDLGTVALFVDRGTPFLLLTLNFGDISKYRCPNPRYLLYRYLPPHWTQVELSQVPYKRLRSNMTFAVRDKRDEIRGSGFRLSVSQTQASTYQYKQWVMNFEHLQTQTFTSDRNECALRHPDYLIDQ